MAFTQDGRATPGNAAVENAVKALRATLVPRTKNSYGVAATSGTLAAALAANSSVFNMRLDPASPRLAFVERIRLEFTTIVAFTTPVTAGRRLAVLKGSAAAAATGGTAIASAGKKHTAGAVLSEFDAVQGGDIRIATTAALVQTLTAEQQFAEMSLVHVGAAGAFKESIFEFNASDSCPLVIEPGQVLSIRNPVAMDAAGTWQLAVRVDWYEALDFGDSATE